MNNEKLREPKSVPRRNSKDGSPAVPSYSAERDFIFFCRSLGATHVSVGIVGVTFPGPNPGSPSTAPSCWMTPALKSTPTKSRTTTLLSGQQNSKTATEKEKAAEYEDILFGSAP